MAERNGPSPGVRNAMVRIWRPGEERSYISSRNAETRSVVRCRRDAARQSGVGAGRGAPTRATPIAEARFLAQEPSWVMSAMLFQKLQPSTSLPFSTLTIVASVKLICFPVGFFSFMLGIGPLLVPLFRLIERT